MDLRPDKTSGRLSIGLIYKPTGEILPRGGVGGSRLCKASSTHNPSTETIVSRELEADRRAKWESYPDFIGCSSSDCCASSDLHGSKCLTLGASGLAVGLFLFCSAREQAILGISFFFYLCAGAERSFQVIRPPPPPLAVRCMSS